MKESCCMITGAFSDIAQAVVRRMHDDGARFVITDVKPQAEGDALAGELGERVSYRVCDIADPVQVAEVFQSAAEEMGRLDVVFAHAGISLNHPFEKIPAEDWKRVVDVNLNGTFYTAKEAAKIMKQQEPGPSGRRGTVIFTSTWVADLPLPGCANYNASKAGINQMLRSAAQELAGQNITFNAVAPGFVGAGKTQQIYDTNASFRNQVNETVPLQRMCAAEELAGLYHFLAGGDAAYMTGVIIPFDGGASLVNRQLWND